MMVNTAMNIDDYDVCIFTEGGKKFGYGHIIRCVSLYDELIERGFHPVFIINSNHDIKKTLYGKKYIIDLWYGNTKYYLQKRPYSIVDSYHADVNDYKEIVKYSKKSLFIDDMCRLDYPKGIVVNPSIYIDKFDYKKKPGQTYLLGSKYVILRKEFTDTTIRVLKNSIENVVIIMGGSDLKDLTPSIINSIIEYDLKIKKVHVIIGAGFGNVSNIEQISKNKKVKLHYNLNAADLKDIMLRCDIAVSAAGQTTNELIAAKLPFVCIKIADNQSNNIQGLLSMGLIDDYIDSCEAQFDYEKFEKIYKQLMLHNKRQGIVSRMENFDMRFGARNIVDCLLYGKVQR